MRSFVTLGLASGLTLAACSERQPCPSEGPDEGLSARIDIALGTCNRAPTVAVVGSRQASKGEVVSLDATPSTDPNGDALRYTWALTSKPAGSETVLMGAAERKVSFLVDRVGAFVVSLEVGDGALTTKSPDIVVVARNDPPTAVAGDDVSVELGVRVTVDGSSSSDVNGDALTYAWTIVERPPSSQFVLAAPEAPSFQFLPDVRGPYVLELTVSDGELSATDQITVRAGISANVPVAVAQTATPTIAVGGAARYDGTASTDADGDMLSHRWQLVSIPARSTAVLTEPNTASGSFVPDQPGDYRLELTVDDGYHQSIPSAVVISAFGDPQIRCTGTIPFTNSATLSGSTVGGGNDYETGCGPMGQGDVVLSYTAPTDLDSLDVHLDAGFSAVLAVYVDDCGPAARRECIVGMQSDASLGRIRAGQTVAIIIDGGAQNAAGDYQVSVSGRIASGRACVPGDTSFTCDLGPCQVTAAGPRCPAILDCADGIDVDDDGMIDEDACTSPPVLTCPPDARVDVLATTRLMVTNTSTSPIIRRRWTVEEEPLGSSLVPSPRDRADTSVRPLLYGDYRLRYTQIDEDLEASACETVLSAGTEDALRVELIWNPTIPEELHASDVDLHLLHPDATAWWNDLDCYFGNRNPDWDLMTATDDDPRLDLDDTSGRGPENINILAPAVGRAYRVGVHYFSDHGYGPSAVYVNVYCYNQLSQRFGPVTMTNDRFWKIADVTIGATDCTITPLSAQGGAPLIVSEDESRMAR